MRDEEMEKVRDAITESETHFQELTHKSKNFRVTVNDLEEDIRILQAEEDRRDSCASQSNGCCFGSVMGTTAVRRGSSSWKTADPRYSRGVQQKIRSFQSLRCI